MLKKLPKSYQPYHYPMHTNSAVSAKKMVYCRSAKTRPLATLWAFPSNSSKPCAGEVWRSLGGPDTDKLDAGATGLSGEVAFAGVGTTAAALRKVSVCVAK